MTRKLLGGALFLLLGSACFGQTPMHGLVAGQSVRTDVERVAGKPVKAISQTLIEYHPADFDPKVWDKSVTKLYVQYRVDSPIVERMEALIDKPINRDQALRNLERSTNEGHQPPLPKQPSASGKNGPHLVEYFGAPYYIVVTFDGGDEKSGVSRTARYSKELYESAVKSASSPSAVPSGSAAGASTSVTRTAPAPTPAAGSVTGRWSGYWTNSKGGSGQNSLVLKEDNGVITGAEDDGTNIMNGRRSGNSMSWEYRNVANCRDYQVRAELSADGKFLNGTYQVNDRCAKNTYSGNYLNYHR